MADKKMTQKMADKKITKKMTFSEILERKPGSTEILMNAGMHCIGCPMAQMETLEEGCIAHGMDVNEILKKLNSDD